jgi:hypothetical protein
MWVESTGVCFQSLARRSRYSIRPLKFECDCFLTQNAFWGSGTARHLGPTPRGRLKFGRMLACRTRTARNRRVKDARRSVTGPLSAASARYLRICDSDFGVVKRDFSKWRHRIAPKPAVLVNSPPRFTLRRRACDFFFRSVLTSNRHQTTWFCPSAATQLRAGLRLPIGCTTIQPVPETNPVPCQGAVEGYCIPRKSAVPPTPPNATQARAQALLSFVVYLSGQLTSFRCM